MAAAKPTDYQALSQELDQIIDVLQAGELDIDDALKSYQRGVTIVQQLQKYLKEASNKVTKVKANFEK